MSLPSRGETFSKLLEYLRKAQEEAATLAHLEADNDKFKSQGWLAVSEMLGNTVRGVTRLATKTGGFH